MEKKIGRYAKCNFKFNKTFNFTLSKIKFYSISLIERQITKDG